ncbi:MAG: GmrSD restriction endonuclease domain-containing protein [Acidimicrobiales bacterium]
MRSRASSGTKVILVVGLTVLVLVLVASLSASPRTGRTDPNGGGPGGPAADTPAPSAPPTSAGPGAAEVAGAGQGAGPFTPPSAAAGRGLLAQLRIIDGALVPGGYSRDLFPTWSDLDANGCDARADTLIAESLTPVGRRPGCEVVAGTWVSIYDGARVTDPASLDVDHLVPLAEAWRSGAAGWDASRRRAFANHIAYADHLIAVTRGSNRSKGDDPPHRWRPPRREAWCRYAVAWVSVKIAWSLSATTPERDALGQMLDTCPA